MSAFEPLVEELRPAPDAEAVLARLARRPRCLFLDSALRDPHLGRYSFLAADPCAWLERPAGAPNVFADLRAWLAPWQTEQMPELPPFQGGAAGLLGYDLNRSLERIAPPRFDEFALPALAVGLYDVVLALDHVAGRAWIISQGWPERETARRRQRASQRLAEFKEWLCEPVDEMRPAQPRQPSLPDITATALAPQFPVRGIDGLSSNFPPDEYRRTIARAIEYIYAGDIFQVNLAQRLLHPATTNSVELYLRLRRRNPAPFAGYFDLGDFQIVSASPERFVQVAGGQVEARPIKGTRRRTFLPEADLFAGDELQESEKDRAENVMIVDLLRNDLSRVCRPESVHVSQLCRLEVYEFVQHLVSVVRGELAPERTALNLVEAAFPGGSITGAPKVRAMEIIAELEPTARGAYCGALGYLGPNGALDLNILIRTITAGRGWWQFPVGGGIVAQSDPEREYEETWHKAEGMIRALR